MPTKQYSWQHPRASVPSELEIRPEKINPIGCSVLSYTEAGLPSSSRPNPILPLQLEPDHKRHVGAECNPRLPTGTGVKPFSNGSSATTTVQTAGDQPLPRGSRETNPERESISAAVCKPDFHGPKERRNSQTDNRSESSEQIRKTSAFQDGGATDDQGCPA